MTRMLNMIAVVAAVGMSGYLLVTQTGSKVSTPPATSFDDQEFPPERDTCEIGEALYRLRGEDSVTLRVERAYRFKDWVFPKKLDEFQMEPKVLYRLESPLQSPTWFVAMQSTKNASAYLTPVTRAGQVVPLKPSKMLPVGYFGFYDEVMTPPKSTVDPAPEKIFAPGLASYAIGDAEGVDSQIFEIRPCVSERFAAVDRVSADEDRGP